HVQLRRPRGARAGSRALGVPRAESRAHGRLVAPRQRSGTRGSGGTSPSYHDLHGSNGGGPVRLAGRRGLAQLMNVRGNASTRSAISLAALQLLAALELLAVVAVVAGCACDDEQSEPQVFDHERD